MEEQNDYVSFEVAKLLKEKGYNKISRSYYCDGKFFVGVFELTNDDRKGDGYCSAPSLAQAAKWLRNKHHIDIEVMVYNKFGQYYVKIRRDTRLMMTEDITEESYEAALNEGVKEALKRI